MFGIVTVSDTQAAVVSRVGFFINDDYWLAMREYSPRVQNEVIGSLTRLYFTGTDQIGTIGNKNARSLYLAIRERVSKAGKKANSRSREGGENMDEIEDKNALDVSGQNGTFPKKRERENINTYTSKRVETLPTREEDAKTSTLSSSSASAQAGNALGSTSDAAVFGGETAEPGGVPSDEGGADVYAYISAAIRAFTEITGRQCNIPSRDVVFAVRKIFDAGYTLDDVRDVIRAKNDEWAKDKKMQAYIRPETLLGAKFESYLAAARAAKEVKKDDKSARFAGRI